MTTPKISALLALDSLAEASTELNDARNVLRDKLNQRDRLIQDAFKAGIRKRTVAQHTGISMKRIDIILAKNLDADNSMARYDAGASA